LTGSKSLVLSCPPGWTVSLYDDFMPYSFFWVEEKDGQRGLVGGLIYHGQTPTNGMEQFSICLTPTTGWAIHT
jgi:hypothetical protein